MSRPIRNPRSISRPRSLKAQAGSMLIEAFVAAVIFTVGVLALIKLQAEGIRMTTESKGRSDASYLADKVLGDLAGQDLQTGAQAASTAVTRFNGNYTATSAPATADATVAASWQTMLARTLPAGNLNVAVESSADPLNTANSVRAATITVTWTFAGGTARSFSQVARLVD
jgi:type IV pilus assembly protein PilV